MLNIVHVHRNSGDLELDLFLVESMSRKDPICIQPTAYLSLYPGIHQKERECRPSRVHRKRR